MLDIVGVGDNVWVTLPSLPHNVYNSTVEDMDANSIYLSLPSKNGLRLPLRKKLKLRISVMAKTGRINFMSQVEDLVTEGSLKLLKISMPSEVKSEQLRKYFRVPVNNMPVKILTKSDAFPASVTNLSGGGCLLATRSRDFRAGDKVKLDFAGKIGLWEVEAKVVRINATHGVAFQFIMKETEREKIVRYVLRRQLESAV
ncbi:MAG: PilZ domain-containing protein [Deferribacteraceae bacterium]|jgi:c-di-GMP-binding flagellar brake protein YcgR|nr:PilZ domain-containing protein [Deferribacteraceae bacterium]